MTVAAGDRLGSWTEAARAHRCTGIWVAHHERLERAILWFEGIGRNQLATSARDIAGDGPIKAAAVEADRKQLPNLMSNG